MSLAAMREWQSVGMVLLGLVLIGAILWDAFETMVLTRTVSRRWRFTGLFYFATRPAFYRMMRRRVGENRRHSLLSVYPPLSLFVLVACWAAALIMGFALLYDGLRIHLTQETETFGHYLYFSGTTFLTLGYGDLTPVEAIGRTLAVLESGTGFLFLALIISYLPVFYAAVQRREVMITMLDSRAGSTPSGHELLRRHAEAGCLADLIPTLREYEKWGAELLEAYLSYPVLSFYRSQHDDQSWLLTATAILDACALIEGGFEGEEPWSRSLRFQAHNTLAMLRHVLVDLAYILKLEPDFRSGSRLTPEIEAWVREDLARAGLTLRSDADARERLVTTLALYEPYALGMGDELLMPVPSFGRADVLRDNWQIAAWDGHRHEEPGDQGNGEAATRSR